MRRKITATLLALSMVLCMVGTASAAEYVSIDEIREVVAGGWHETYEAHDRTITVDVDVNVPEVEAIPAVRIALPQNLTPKAPAGAKIGFEDGTGFTYSLYSQENAFSAEGASPKMLFEENSVAENSPLTRDEAIAFARDLILQHEDALGSLDMELKMIIPHTRAYKILSSDAYEMELDFNAPQTQMGHYWVDFYQLFHGVPYLINGAPRSVPITGKAYGNLPNRLRALIGSVEDYAFSFHPTIEREVIHESLPLVEFSTVRQVFEGLIRDGYIREVYDVRLGYMSYIDPENPGKDFVLLPVWVLYGSIVDRPNAPDAQVSGWGKEFEVLSGGQYAVVNAQTGEYIDPQDGRASRDNAVIIAD